MLIVPTNYNCFALHFFCMRGKQGEPSEPKIHSYIHTNITRKAGSQEEEEKERKKEREREREREREEDAWLV